MSLSRNLENNRIVSKPEIVSKAGMTGKGGKSFRLATRIATAFAAVLMAAGMALIGAGGMAFTGVAGTLALTVSAAETSGADALKYPDRTILSGISISGVDVSGMTETEALTAVTDSVETQKQSVITLKGKEEGQEVAVTAGNLGLKFLNEEVIDEAGQYGHGTNVIARYKEEKDLEKNGANITGATDLDRNMVLAVLSEQCAAFNQEAVNCSLSRASGTFEIIDGKTGYVVNDDESADKITETLTGGSWDGKDTSIDLDIDVDEPQGDAETLSKVKDLLGTYTTSYPNSGSNRCNNIANGCSLINGKTLYPGEQLSVLNTITPFTEENGYYLAGSYLGSQVVESFGGGICQVSTTLYNAVIRAELQIDERYNHSLIVSYVEPSMDAAIAESSGMDFKFTNNQDYPVYIEGYTAGKSITFNVYGVETRDPGRTVEFESETLETIEPEGEEIYTDSTQPVGYISVTSAHTGYKARLWKIVKQDGEQVSKDVFNNSTYNAAPTSATVGTAGTVSEALQAAIDSKSIDSVKAALSGDTGQAAADTVTTAAQEIAQEAYAAALAAGSDETAAMAAAQQAAQQYVAAQTQAAGTTAGATGTSSDTTGAAQ